MKSPLELTKQLIEKKSVTPEDAGCFTLISSILGTAGFTLESFDRNETKNLFAHYGTTGPLFVFLGHTDVVPSGPEKQWTSPPFIPTERDGFLYGRGAADMKSGVAAMTWALAQFVTQQPNVPFRVGLLLTSDEEGTAEDGIKYVITQLTTRNISIDYCLVGEPSSSKILGDTLKIGRRGTLSGRLTVHGKQGHIAYPHLADNPIHRFAHLLTELTQTVWDKHHPHFQPTQIQFSNVQAGTGANNVIPGTLFADFNFRFSTHSTPEQLQERTEMIVKKHAPKASIEWHLGGHPFFTGQSLLLECAKKAVNSVLNITPTLSTAGGTSDGRFIAPTGAEVIELGVCHESIHQIDECVKIDDIQKIADTYLNLLQQLHTQLNKNSWLL